VRVIETVDKVYDVDISPDGSRIAVGLENGHALVYSLTTGEREADLFVSGGWAWDVEFDPTGARIVVVQPTVTRLWNAKTFELERSLEEQKLGMFRACFSPDGKYVATGSTGNSLSGDDETEARVWEVANGTLVATIPGLTFRVRPSFRPDGKALLVSSEASGRLAIMDMNEPHVIRRLAIRDNGVAYSAWSPDGKTVLSVTADMCGRLWKAESGKELHVLRGHTGFMMCGEFSPDGKEVSTTSWADHTTRIWNVTTGKERLVLAGHADRLLQTRFAPDGRSLASVDAAGVGLLFELQKGTVAARYEGHKGIVAGLAFTPDGKLIVTGGHDGTVRVWKNPIAK
jgi:WD40 repeat protein